MTLLDTAGIRETDDPVELEGVRRARERAAGADLVLWVVDAGERSAAQMLQQRVQQNRSAAGRRSPVIPGAAQRRTRTITRLRNSGSRPSGDPGMTKADLGPPTWLIRNKIDLIQGANQRNESGIQIMITNELKPILISP